VIGVASLPLSCMGQITGNPQFAGYDPPFTLPLLRRNEVWIELETA